LKFFVCVLLIFAITPAFAEQRPAFLPLRDVVVNYTLSVPGRPDAQYQLSYSAAGQLARVDDPVRGIYALANLPAGTAELVVPALHSIVTAPDVAGITGEIYSAGGARFTPLGHGNFAGLACEKYLILSTSGSGTACLTPDGVALYFNGKDAHGSAEVTATAVSYAPQAAATFAAPDGFGAINLPPDALAQLLGQ
jgi:hypothetical protein